MAAPGAEKDALESLRAQFEDALDAPEPDVSRAHDLLRLLDEWPINQNVNANGLRMELRPRLEIFGRAARDREASRKYLVRTFEKRALKLLWEDSPQWMLQVHAPGGRGKTMFLRNLQGRTCPEKNVPAARIDFDYLAHLSVATNAPWRILLSIARQLNPQLPRPPFTTMLRDFGEFQARLFSEVHPRRRSTGAIDEGYTMDTDAVSGELEVPRKFRENLAIVAGDRPIVVVLDTVEAVLHAHGADLEPLLQMLSEVRSGAEGEGEDSLRVPGLRVILCGRFDLEGTRTLADGRKRPRLEGFNATWVGPESEVRIETDGGTTLRFGREVLSLELPAFSLDETRKYLETMWDLGDRPAMIEVIADRCKGNPMKIALVAEHVKKNPQLKVKDVAAFESVELFYLVDRVVDRIDDEDGTIQWLLRWGVLPRILTRAFVDAVVWPALVEFVKSRHSYDDPDKDPLPESRHGFQRWKTPKLETVRDEGAADRAWDGLLDYAASASWVSVTEDLTDAVVFHPEVRGPLRRLLREGGHPAYDDIHRKAFQYCQRQSETEHGAALTAAVSGLVFHAYQRWHGDRPDPAQLLSNLWQRFAANRDARRDIAEAVLESNEDEDSDPVQPRELALARLELAEWLVYAASERGTAIEEAQLDRLLTVAKPSLGERERRRTIFLGGVLAVAMNQLEDGWLQFASALNYPGPEDEDGEDGQHHLKLMVDWVWQRTPPVTAVEDLRRLENEARCDPALAIRAAMPLTRVLLGAERWREALEVAQRAESAELEARALLGLGNARQVLEGNYPVLRRAEAALMRYDPQTALELLASEEPIAEVQLLQGRAYIMSDDRSGALSFLSSAVTGNDHTIADEALIKMGRALIDWRLFDEADSELKRIPADSLKAPILRLRVSTLKVLAAGLRDPEAVEGSAGALRSMREEAISSGALPPSVLVEIELARLELESPGKVKLDDLASALEKMDAPGARLLALRGLSRVKNAPGPAFSETARLLRDLTAVNHDLFEEPAIKLGQAELERILHTYDAGRRILSGLLAVISTAAEPIISTAAESIIKGFVTAALARLRDEGEAAAEAIPPKPEDGEEHLALRIWSESGTAPLVHVQFVLSPSKAHQFTGRSALRDCGEESFFLLSKDSNRFCEALGEALMVDYLKEGLMASPDPFLQLLPQDDLAARMPWELATYQGSCVADHLRVKSVVRSFQARQMPSSDPAPVHSLVALVNLVENRESESSELGIRRAIKSYENHGSRPKVLRASELHAIGKSSTSDLAMLDSKIRIVHLLAEIAKRRSGAGLRASDGTLLTPRNLGHWLDDGQPRLLILDLALDSSPVDAAEQLMLANSFCWTLTQGRPHVSVLCGVFAAYNPGAINESRIMDRLTRAFAEAETLFETVGSLQRLQTFRSDVDPEGSFPHRHLRLLGNRSSAFPDRRRVMSLLQFSLSCLQAQLENLEADLGYWRDLTKEGAKLPQHNSQVDRIIKTLTGTRSAALAKTPLEPKQPTGEPDGESVEATLGDLPELRRSVGTIHLLWEFFRDKLAQRLVDAVDEHLGVGDDLAWDCYKPCLDAAVGDDPEKRARVKEPPLVFYSTDRTAFAQARTKTFHPLGLDSIDLKEEEIAEVLQSLPVPVVGIPWAIANRLPDLVVLGHEVGHVVAEDLELAADVKGLLRSIDYPGDPGKERKRVWEKWSDEVFGDVFGVFATGQAFVDALGGEFAGDVENVRGQSINRRNPGSYPTPTLRMAICEALLRRLGITPSPMWSADFGALTGNSLAFEKDVDLVVDALVDNQWAGLAGKKLGEVLPWDETHETNAKAVADAYLLPIFSKDELFSPGLGGRRNARLAAESDGLH